MSPLSKHLHILLLLLIALVAPQVSASHLNGKANIIQDASPQFRTLKKAQNPAELTYTPEFYSPDDNGNIYLIDRESLSVFRWSTTTNRYLDTWPLSASPTAVAYSIAHQRLYLGYASGKITWISPSETIAQEHELTTLTREVKYLLAAGNYLFAADTSDAPRYYDAITEYSLDRQGRVVDSQSESQAQQYLWSPATNRIYRHRDAFFEWIELNPNTGEFGERNDPFTYNYYSQSISTLSISDDGQYIIDNAGQLFDANTRKPVNLLSRELDEGVWVNGKLITISQLFTEPYPQLTFWNTNFEELSSYPLTRATDAHLLKVNKNLLLIQQVNSRPSFSLFAGEQLADTDKDQIHDLLDNCIAIANPDQADFDGDSQGNACDTDDDNDGLRDNIEADLNLNPLDPSDAEGDLDKDGFSNIVELISGSSLVDVNSLPKALSNYYENLENGWPAGFTNRFGESGWTLHAEGSSGLSSLISPPVINGAPSNEVNFTALFSAGELSFKYRLDKSASNFDSYSLVLFVDDITVYYQTEFDRDWQTIKTNLTRGIHKISIRTSKSYTSNDFRARFIIDDIKFQSNPYNMDTDGDGIGQEFDNCPAIANEPQADIDSDGLGDACDLNDDRPKDTDLDDIYDYSDNCPNVPNRDQLDIDGDGKGDACDPTDDRPKDSDLDGIYDDIDNCPLISNLQSENMDDDKFGDACDSDIDGDGVTNEEERKFSFMNERDSSDASKDQDDDGADNAYEITHSMRPDLADIFPTISLFDYFPLGEINSSYSYISGNSRIYADTSMKRSTTANTYVSTTKYYAGAGSGSESTSQYERKDTGIYLIHRTSSNSSIEYSNYLVFPVRMKLGETITSQSKTISSAINRDSITENITFTFKLIETGTTEWKGISYPSITIKRTTQINRPNRPNPYEEYTSELTYLKGIGMISGTRLDFTYNKIEIISLDQPHKAETPPPAQKKSGGGAMDFWLLLSLALFALAGRNSSLYFLHARQ